MKPTVQKHRLRCAMGRFLDSGCPRPPEPPASRSWLSQAVPTSRLFMLVVLVPLLSVFLLAVPFVAALNLQAYYQGLLLVVAPLTVLSFALSLFSILLTFCLIRNAGSQAASKAGGAEGPPPDPQTVPAAAMGPSSNGDRFDQAALASAEEYTLTKRESEVFALLLQGRNAERISQSLYISKHTAKSHIYNIYRKAGASSQQELIDLFQQRQAAGGDRRPRRRSYARATEEHLH